MLGGACELGMRDPTSKLGIICSPLHVPSESFLSHSSPREKAIQILQYLNLRMAFTLKKKKEIHPGFEIETENRTVSVDTVVSH